MLLIPNRNHDPALNLAMEEYILTGMGLDEPVLFFYVNDPSIIIGRHQNTSDEINTDYVREKGIRIVRRCSGGGAVYHDNGNLNYSLIRPGAAKSGTDFAILLEPILTALHGLGLPAELGGRNDLLINGAKFSGNAYYHNRAGSVTHGTLLFDSDLSVLSLALRPNPLKLKAKGIRSVRSRVCCIKEFLPSIGKIGDLEDAVIAQFSKRETVSTRNFSADDINKYMQLADQRYRNDLWTFGESPAFTFRRLISQPGGWIDFRADIRENMIINARFFGDFFCPQDIINLESALAGIRWTENSLSETLRISSWENYFPEYPLESFIRDLFSATANG